MDPAQDWQQDGKPSVASSIQELLPCGSDHRDADFLFPSWERNLIAWSVIVHMAASGFDLMVAAGLLAVGELYWFILSGSISLVSAVASFVIMRYEPKPGQVSSADIDDESVPSIAVPELVSVVGTVPVLQVALEAHECLQQSISPRRFYQLRRVEVVLQSLPSSLLQLCILAAWARHGAPSPFMEAVVQLAVLGSLLSVGLGLATWEHQVQVDAPARYVIMVAVFRMLELASRCSTIAFFALAAGWSTLWVLSMDYALLLVLMLLHGYAYLLKGLVLAVPLILVNIEPFVWQPNMTVVPKDMYYSLRLIEFILMWTIAVIGRAEGGEHCHDKALSSWMCSGLGALLTTLAFFGGRPLLRRSAERFELPAEEQSRPSRICLVTAGLSRRTPTAQPHIPTANEEPCTPEEEDEELGVKGPEQRQIAQREAAGTSITAASE